MLAYQQDMKISIFMFNGLGLAGQELRGWNKSTNNLNNNNYARSYLFINLLFYVTLIK